jgi:hypothetical protein
MNRSWQKGHWPLPGPRGVRQTDEMTTTHSGESKDQKWLDANAARLASIAEESGTPAELVHLVAVLVLAGLPDDAIRRELWLPEFRYRTHQPLEAAKLGVTMQVVRELLEMTGC